MYNIIPGQVKEKATLSRMVTSNRLPHALLILGNAGYGGLSMAITLANHMICLNPLPESPCGECKACVKSTKLIHPDIHFSFPVIKKGTKKREDTTSKDFLIDWRAAIKEMPTMTYSDWATYIDAENKQLNINTKECNEIIQKLSLKSFESEFKVLILWMPEYLGKESNRLLKLIEEPPPNTKVIMIAEDQERILPTILSRCQLIRLNPVSDEVLKSHLLSTGVADNEALKSILNLSMGNYGTALKLINHNEQDFSTLLLDWLRMSYMVDKDPAKLIQWITSLSTQAKDLQKSFFRYGLHFFREYLIGMLSEGYKMKLSDAEIQVATKMKAIITYDKIEYIINELDSLVTLLDRNANMKVALLSSSITINELMKGKKQPELIA